MFMFIEVLCKQHQYTLAALSAIGTVSAVITAIYLAHRNEYVRLTAYVSVWLSVNPGQIRDEQTSIQISISNIGLRSAWLPNLFFAWKFPFDRVELAVLHKSLLTFPVEVTPGRQLQIKLLDTDNFKKEFTSASEHLKYFKAARIRWCRAFICTEDGQKIWVKISPSLRKDFKQLSKVLK